MLKILVLDTFERADFSWTIDASLREIGFDLVYNPLDFVGCTARRKSGQALTVMGLAIDLFDSIEEAVQSRTPSDHVDLQFVATGLGAMITLQLAILLRGRDDMNVTGMFLLSASSSAPSRGFLLQSAKLVNSPAKYLEMLLSPTYQSSKALQSMFAENFEKYVNLLEQVIDAIQEFQLSSEEIMLLTNIPTQFLHGNRNRMIDQTHSMSLANHWHAASVHASSSISSQYSSNVAQLLLVPNTGHWIQVEQPALVAQVLGKWLLAATCNTLALGDNDSIAADDHQQKVASISKL